jgi:uncharacterized repeat protein (TIGR02543 family)
LNNKRILNILTICASAILGVSVFGMSEPVKVYAQNDSTIDLPTGDISDPEIRVGEVQSEEITPEEFSELEGNVPRRRAKFASYNGNYYNQLTTTDKLYYNAILEASVKNIGANEKFSENTSILFYTGNEALEDPDWTAILDALEYDHPEQLESIVYGVSRYRKYTTDNDISNYAYYIYFTPKSSYTGAQLAQMESTLQSKLDSFYAGLTLTGDDANKEMIIHDALIDAIEYDHECANNDLAFDVAHTAYGALVDHSAVCDGYSKAFKMLLNKAGIDAEVVAGLGNGGGHAWNVVKIGDSWYETDVTWDDQPDYIENKYYFMLSHEYFNLTTSDFNSHLEDTPGFVSHTTTHVRSSKYLSYLEPPVAYGTEKSYRNIKQVYKISFNGTMDGASVYPSSSYTYEGKLIGMPSYTYLSGYDFDNWYTEEAGGSIVTSDTIFKKASTVYARWIPVDVNVYLQTEIGSTEIITLKYGEAYSSKLPDNLKREGYVFAGWYLDSGYTDRVTASTKVSKSYNHNLYARWISNGEHNIYFNANGGEVDIESVVMAGGTEIGDMPTPTRYGYNFRGWYDAQEGGNKITRYTVVSADAELYAHWTPVSVIVYFYKNDGSVSYSSKSVDYEGTYENALSSLYKYTWLGHTLIGWFTEKDGGTQITPDTIVKTTDSHNLYAHWSVDSYTVSLDANGGSVDEESVSVEWGTSYGSLPTPVRYGYTFDGWYDESGKLMPVYNKIVKDIALHAVWTPVDVNVYLSTGLNNTERIALKFGEVYSNKLPYNLSKKGCLLEGWYLDSGYENKVQDNTTVSNAATHYLYARWISNGDHNITYNPNGGKADTENVILAGGDVFGDMPTPTRYGYNFEGWFDDAEGGNEITSSSVVSEDAELYAHWTPVSVMVYFYKNDGSVSYSSMYVDYEGTYENALSSLYKYTWSGHTLIGWFTEKDGGTQITPDTIVKTTDSHNLYAHWSVDSYTVSLDANGGSVDKESVSVEWGTSYGSLPTPVRYGYTFDGWYDESGEPVSAHNKIEKDIALHAVWTPVDVYVQLSTGLKNDERITLKFGEAYSNKLPANLNKKGYLLEGWYLDSGYENKVQDDTTVSNAATHYLYARWISNGDHNITYNPNGGEADAENVILAGGDIFGNMPTPNRYGYNFVGWFDDTEGGNEITSSSVVSEDAELYAHWTPVQSTVRFYENIGGVNDSYQESNVFYDDTYASALESIINPVNDGFTFIGWYTEPEGGSGINAEAVVTTTDLICVYAHWEKNASEEPGGSDNPAPQEDPEETGKDNQNKSDDVNNSAPQENPQEIGKDNQNKSDDVNNPAPQEDPEGTGKDNQNKSDDVNNPAPQEDPEETGKNNQNKSDDVNKQVPQNHKNDITNGNESGKGSNKSQSGSDQKDNEVVQNETQPASGGQSAGNRDESTPDQSNQGSLDDHARDNSINDDSDKSKIDKSGSGNIGTIAKTSSANTNSTAGNNTAKTSSVKTGSVVVVNGSTYVVTGKNEADYKGIKSGKAETVTIPATIKIKGETYKVTGISSKAFRKKTKLRKVTIGKNVTRIGAQAFEGCTALTTVNGGSSVRTIGAKAYNGCKKLKKAPIGSKVTSIGNMAFYNCSALTNMTIPANVDKLGKQFAGKTPKLKTLTVKTKRLNTKGVTNKAFTGMGSNKTVTKVPKGKAKAYKSLFQKKGLNKKIKVQ